MWAKSQVISEIPSFISHEELSMKKRPLALDVDFFLRGKASFQKYLKLKVGKFN